MTSYELFYQEDAPFRGMPEPVYMKILKLMESAGHATLFNQNGDSKELGIKF